MSGNVRNVIMALLAAILLASCGKNAPENHSAVLVSSGGKEIAIVSEELYRENGDEADTLYVPASFYPEDTDRSSSLLYVSSEAWIEQVGEPEYYPIGSVFEIKFSEEIGMPDNISINDVLITSGGELRYDERAAVKEAVPIINKETVSFVLDDHYATMLSSNSEDYKKGTAYRSFGIVCEWGEYKCRYTFCVRSDPVHVWDE